MQSILDAFLLSVTCVFSFPYRLERLERDKHSSLLRTLKNYSHKEFDNNGPTANICGYARAYYITEAFKLELSQ